MPHLTRRRFLSDSAIAAAVVNLAHTLGMLAIAEGVETNVQLEELRAAQVELAGFHAG